MRRLLRSSLAILALSAACSDKSDRGREAADAPERRKLLENLANGVYLPTYEGFVSEVTRLEAATAQYAKTLAPADLDAARALFRVALLRWERAELMQVGPANYVSDQTPGGMGLRSTIYAYPLSYPCGIDRALVTKAYRDRATLEAATSESGRGLTALEVLLFDTRATTACKADDSTVSAENWQALVEGDLAQRRADYAVTVTKGLRTQGEALVAAWKKDGFLASFTRAGDGSKVFATTHDALNAASDALFYLDTETKDMKLADPAGLSMTCMQIPCPERVEHPHAKLSKESLVANLEAFRDTFRGLPPAAGKGGEMWGFYDLLVSVDAKDVGDEMNGLLDGCLGELAALDGSLEAALEDKDPQLMKIYDKLQALSDRLKTDFVVKLDLKKPSRAAGDND